MNRMLEAARRRWRDVLGVAGVVAVGYLVAASLGPSTEDLSGTPRPAADFALPGLSGETFRLSDFRGQVVLVDFWATYCIPCIEELPDLKALYEKFNARGFSILAVSKDGLPEAVDEFVREYEVPYPVALAGPGPVEGYAVRALPTAFLVDREGMIVKKYLGYKFRDELEADIRALVDAEAAGG